MVLSINSNADLPRCLNAEDKQIKKAKQLVSLKVGESVKSARGPPMQGFFSRTVIVQLKSGEEVVIQFRPEPLDMRPFEEAQRYLGTAVPQIELMQDDELEREDIWAYQMTRIPGTPWFRAISGKGEGPLVPINKSLGKILARGYIQDDSTEVIERRIQPHLEQLVISEHENIIPFKETARDLLGKLDQLRKLPLFVAHYDMNEMNIMVTEGWEVSGLVDWELSSPLPFGVGLGRIHTLAGEYSEGEFHMPDNFEEAERGFWNSIMDGLSPHVRELLQTNMDAVQTAVTLGTLLDTFEVVDGGLGSCSPVAVKALPKLLTYRLPFLRGSKPPYVW